MSNFDFIRLPEKLVSRENYGIDYRGNIVRPERIKKLFIGYYDWIKKFNLPDTKETYDSWRMKVNSDVIWEDFIDPYMRENLNADFIWSNRCPPHTGTGGCEIKLYTDPDYKYLYFYTMNRWKRYGAFGDYKLSKSYRIIIYRIPHSVFEMLGSQDLYKTYMLQYPTGFKFRIMTYEQCMTNETMYLKIKPENNKEIIWKQNK